MICFGIYTKYLVTLKKKQRLTFIRRRDIENARKQK